jgi:hypothetical protein
MRRPSCSRAIVAVTLVLAAIGPLNLVTRASSSGPPAGFTNAPGESNCTACHNSFALNAGTGTFGITVPPNVALGAANSVTIGFTGSVNPKHGFQVTARDATGNPSGAWAVVQSGLTKNASGSVFHHEHTSTGSNSSSWTMAWNAPATLPNGPVIYYTCGNQGNGSFTPQGDYIYYRTTKSFQAVLSTATTAWPIGTVQTLTLTAAGHGGEVGVIVPSEDPTPYVVSGPFELQVNPLTGMFDLALVTPQVFQNLWSNLDVAGQKTATVTIPFYPPLIGLPFYFAGITANASLNPTEVSNRVTVTFQ